jgi:hypothetical protein
MGADPTSPKPTFAGAYRTSRIDATPMPGDRADDGRITDRVFPIAGDAPPLVLYPTTDEGLELRWQLDARSIDRARAAFPDGHGLPAPRLRLLKLSDEGAARVVAEASLEDAHLAAGGHARYPTGTITGPVRGEIGLATADGGWVMVARSNRLLAARSRPIRLPGRTESRPAAVTAASTASAAPGAVAASPRLQRSFPLVGPVRSRSAASAPHPHSFADAVVPAPLRHVPGSPAGRLVVSAEVGGDEASEAGQARNRPGPISREPEGSVLEHADGGSGQPEGPAARSGDSAAASTTVAALPRPGSGPVRSPRTVGHMTLRAELLVQGSAPPGMVLDLGGHPYRVGAGGRFQLRVPILDHALIMRLLAALPELPVESRPGEDAADDPVP